MAREPVQIEQDQDAPREVPASVAAAARTGFCRLTSSASADMVRDLTKRGGDALVRSLRRRGDALLTFRVRRPRRGSFAGAAAFGENTPPPRSPARHIRMNLHEYQAKELFAEYGIPGAARQASRRSRGRGRGAAEALGGSVWVVKAQVHAGGRGKAGGVKLVRDVDAVREPPRRHARHAAGHATRPGRKACRSIRCYVESGSEIEREIYLSLTSQPRARSASPSSPRRPAAWTSRRSRARRPRRSSRVNVASGRRAAGRTSAASSRSALGLNGKQVERVPVDRCARSTSCIYEQDASLVEVNPLIVTEGGQPRGARRQDQHRRERGVPPSGARGAARRRAGRPDGAARRPSTTSTTSRWTATSPAW